MRANIIYYGTDSQPKAIEELKDKVKSSAKLETTEYKEVETKGETRKSWRSALANFYTNTIDLQSTVRREHNVYPTETTSSILQFCENAEATNAGQGGWCERRMN